MKKIVLLCGWLSRSDLYFVKKMVLLDLGGCPSRIDLQSVKMVLLAGYPSRGDLQSVKQIVLLGGCPPRSYLRFVKMVLLGAVGCPC